MTKIAKLKSIPEHQSAVRNMVSESHGLDYKPLKDLEEAKEYDDAYIIMEGDWGGQIYLVAPVRLVIGKATSIVN